jgi:Putative bacterial sensory transduction regulator
MPRWPWRAGQADMSGAQLAHRDTTPAGDHASDDASRVLPLTLERLGAALERLDIRYLTDGDGSLLALWERHAVLFALEGPSDEILVIRARPHATVPRDWADRAYRVVNEWNHTRRFYKAYVGDPTDRGQLPIYAEIQVPLLSGAHDALLLELVDCAAAVAMGFIDWLHDEGALL